MKDEFQFGAKTPANEVELQWKTYETYENGLVVAWDQPPSADEANKPYSTTKVVSDNKDEADSVASPVWDNTTRTISYSFFAVIRIGDFKKETLILHLRD